MESPLSTPPMAAARAEMRRLHRISEPEAVMPLVGALATPPEEEQRILSRGRDLVAELRKGQEGGWVNRFMAEYRMDSDEGLALLSLAEAFLRVPDPDTADLLIADKIGEADWRAHSGR